MRLEHRLAVEVRLRRNEVGVVFLGPGIATPEVGQAGHLGPEVKADAERAVRGSRILGQLGRVLERLVHGPGRVIPVDGRSLEAGLVEKVLVVEQDRTEGREL